MCVCMCAHTYSYNGVCLLSLDCSSWTVVVLLLLTSLLPLRILHYHCQPTVIIFQQKWSAWSTFRVVSHKSAVASPAALQLYLTTGFRCSAPLLWDPPITVMFHCVVDFITSRSETRVTESCCRQSLMVSVINKQSQDGRLLELLLA